METTVHTKTMSSEPTRDTPVLWKMRLSQQATAYLFLLPALLIFGLFAWYPILKAVEMSFQNISLMGESTWAGLDNYKLMFKDPAFEIAWKNSLQFALWSLILGFMIPVVLAVLIREMRGYQGFFRIVYFLPTVVPVTIAVIVWRFIYDPDAGILNEMIKALGGHPQQWLNDVVLAKPSIIAMKTFCAGNLPGYMSPDRFIFHDRLPRTSTDKVDYQTLRRELVESGAGGAVLT